MIKLEFYDNDLIDFNTVSFSARMHMLVKFYFKVPENNK